jgi:hypothetical protein
MCLEVELLALELERRQALSASGDAVALDVGAWQLGGEASEEALPPGEHDALPEAG